ncbi:hypothetical protein TOPH_01977 [Tolypocladium ophioglossoides CBS 100239]|uniref:Uncharacterized protein n=1 Tax=Tolypocladium ophioglossoides (strain CBS 100239) TaxID=1163406 RepID=A0A0L0NHG8_TOLOC|nr:hypothetical protein TOPH_01977 [Tolypocladium ophioglossoides CBS 100239]
MIFPQTITSAAATAFLAFSLGVDAFGTPCVYQQYKCGYNLVATQVYNNTELTTAVNMTGPIPPLATNQLLQVLYRCTDTNGGLAGNSFCIAGCMTMLGNSDDQCAL